MSLRRFKKQGHCSECNRYGEVHFWSHRPMCLKHYRQFCDKHNAGQKRQKTTTYVPQRRNIPKQQPKRLGHCSECNRYGEVHFWSHRPMCLKHYQRFCKNWKTGR